MTATSLLGIITLGIMLIAVLMAVFMLTVPTQNKVGNRLMALYLLILAITISVFFYHPFYSPPLVIEKLRDDINLLSAPLFYFFTLSVLYTDFKLSWKHLWHGFPFLLIFLVFTPNFYAVSNPERIAFFNTYFSHPETYVAMIDGNLQAIFYLVLVFIVLIRYRKVLQENYADASAITHRWLWQMNTLLCVLFVFSLFKNIFKRAVNDYELITWVRIGMVTLLLGFLCWMLLKIMYHPNLFRGVDSRLAPLPDHHSAGEAAGATLGIKAEEASKVAALKHHMESARPFLDPALTVRKLAHQLQWPERELSILINQRQGRHFFDFVNDYRINYAKDLLSDPANAKMTVLEVLYAVGFNSKSSFNVAFKSRTGLTPTQFRKQA